MARRDMFACLPLPARSTACSEMQALIFALLTCLYPVTCFTVEACVPYTLVYIPWFTYLGCFFSVSLIVKMC